MVCGVVECVVDFVVVDRLTVEEEDAWALEGAALANAEVTEIGSSSAITATKPIAGIARFTAQAPARLRPGKASGCYLLRHGGLL